MRAGWLTGRPPFCAAGLMDANEPADARALLEKHSTDNRCGASRRVPRGGGGGGGTGGPVRKPSLCCS